MNKSPIDWGLPNFYTWNPATGCKRLCEYCYARRIHTRFHKTPFNILQYHKERFADKDLGSKKPRNIFVGSMSDIEYWKGEWVERTLDICRNNPQHIFWFLSKNPLAYCGYKWPPNTRQGLTMECTQIESCQEQNIEEMCKYDHPYLSLEPLLGFLKTWIPDWIMRVIVGAMSGQGAIRPRKEWIDSVLENCGSHKIYWKKHKEFKWPTN